MEQLLQTGLTQMGLPTEGIPSLMRYAELLVEKNKVMNLTAITEPHDIATLHFLDSVAMLTLADLKGKKMADVGTGAGFPGMPLRIVEPSLRLTLLDSLKKRIDWLSETLPALEVPADCVSARAEDFSGERREQFDMAVSRAVGRLNILSELCLPLVKPGGCFLAMKALDSDLEISEAAGAIRQLGGTVEAIRDYPIPGTGTVRRAVIIREEKPTPRQFPRRYAKIKQSPLR